MKRRNTAAIILSVIFLAALLGGCQLPDWLHSVTALFVSKPEIVALTDEEAAHCYGYQSLQTDAERDFYNTFGAYVTLDEPKQFKVDYTEDTERLAAIAEMYCFDHPEVFWVDGEHAFSYLADGEKSLKLSITYTITGAELQAAKQALATAVTEALDGIPADADDFGKERYINDYLIDTVAYDEAAAAAPEYAVGYEHNAYGALVEKKCVCDGFSTAFMLLAQQVGIDSYVVFGTAPDSGENEYHAWNSVLLGDDWYYLDITWNDASDETAPAIGRYINFNMTTEQILQDHTILPLYGEAESSASSQPYNYFVPECTATEYNYFEYNCDKVTAPGEYEVLADGLAAAAENGEEYYCFKVSDALDFATVYDDLMSGALADCIAAVNSGGTVQLQTRTCVYSETVNRIIIVELNEK